MFLWRFSSRWLDRPAERSYAGSAAALAGAWLTVATATGPGSPPLPTVWLLGTLAAGLPWWTHRRRRARVRVERTLESWPRVAEETGLAGSRVVSAVVDRWGWRALIHLRGGQTATDALNRLPAIESALGTRRGAGRIEPDPDRADRAYLRVLDRDPHAEPVPWPGTAATTITDPRRTRRLRGRHPRPSSTCSASTSCSAEPPAPASPACSTSSSPPSPAAPTSWSGAST